LTLVCKVVPQQILSVELYALLPQHAVLPLLVTKLDPQQILKVGLYAELLQHAVFEPDVSQLALSAFLRIIKFANKKNKILCFMIF
jgi:hypothetical protein